METMTEEEMEPHHYSDEISKKNRQLMDSLQAAIPEGKLLHFLDVDAPVHAQNNYHFDTFEDHPELKYKDYAEPQCEKFTEYLQQNQNAPVWGMNFLSAYIDVLPNQYDVAKEVNHRFARFVNSNPQLYLGIVLMDYFACPFYKSTSATTTNGDLVVEAVINNNRRFWDYNKIYGSGKDRREPFEMKQN